MCREEPADQASRSLDINELIALTVDNGVTEHIGRRAPRGDPHTLAERYRELLADLDRLVLVAVDEAGQRLVGFAVLVEEQIGVLAPAVTLYVSHLLVAPAFRRRGAGRALLTGAVRHAEDREISHVVVAVQAGARTTTATLPGWASRRCGPPDRPVATLAAAWASPTP